MSHTAEYLNVFFISFGHNLQKCDRIVNILLKTIEKKLQIYKYNYTNNNRPTNTHYTFPK